MLVKRVFIQIEDLPGVWLKGWYPLLDPLVYSEWKIEELFDAVTVGRIKLDDFHDSAPGLN